MNSGGAAAPAPKEEEKNVPAKAGDRVSDKPAPKAFTGGEQGFLDLKLLNVETVNHNTKRFRFELPEKDQVCGLHVACEYIQWVWPTSSRPPANQNSCHHHKI